jgi:uncharacterized protein (DUF2336 family)
LARVARNQHMSDTPRIDAETHDPRPEASAKEAHRVCLGVTAAAPAEILTKLAAGPSVRVRTLCAARLANLAPRLDAGAQSPLHQQAVAALARLVEDEAVRVRAAIAGAVKEMPDAPREVMLRLARDSAIEVSGPVALLCRRC